MADLSCLLSCLPSVAEQKPFEFVFFLRPGTPQNGGGPQETALTEFAKMHLSPCMSKVTELFSSCSSCLPKDSISFARMGNMEHPPLRLHVVMLPHKLLAQWCPHFKSVCCWLTIDPSKSRLRYSDRQTSKKNPKTVLLESYPPTNQSTWNLAGILEDHSPLKGPPCQVPCGYGSKLILSP